MYKKAFIYYLSLGQLLVIANACQVKEQKELERTVVMAQAPVLQNNAPLNRGQEECELVEAYKGKGGKSCCVKPPSKVKMLRRKPY